MQPRLHDEPTPVEYGRRHIPCQRTQRRDRPGLRPPLPGDGPTQGEACRARGESRTETGACGRRRRSPWPPRDPQTALRGVYKVIESGFEVSKDKAIYESDLRRYKSKHRCTGIALPAVVPEHLSQDVLFSLGAGWGYVCRDDLPVLFATAQGHCRPDAYEFPTGYDCGIRVGPTHQLTSRGPQA